MPFPAIYVLKRDPRVLVNITFYSVSKLPLWDLVALAPIYSCIPWHWLNEELVRWLKRLTSMQMRGKLWWWWSFPEFPEQKNPWISLKSHPRFLYLLRSISQANRWVLNIKFHVVFQVQRTKLWHARIKSRVLYCIGLPWQITWFNVLRSSDMNIYTGQV